MLKFSDHRIETWVFPGKSVSDARRHVEEFAVGVASSFFGMVVI
jgi:hypothetical protein